LTDLEEDEMSWTDERVEMLRKLWLDGLSASQIAAELAHGITRNAVIGKVHRLGLSGRVKAPSTAAPRPQRPRPATSRAAPRPAAPAARGNLALAFRPTEAPEPAPIEDVVIPMSEMVEIMDLREGMCRWPVGDPTTAEFRFCGSKTHTVGPYCTHHARIAYQPAQERRRERDRERRAQQALSRL
jgi:GcrA cell cycle regulator